MSFQFQDALRDLEERGFIERGEIFVRVLDHQGLREYASRRRSLNERWEAHIAQAIAQVHAEIAAESQTKVAEIREAELRMLQRLMIDARGANWSGRGSVRIVHRSRL
jgi:hypothetical protein